tara:strand:+ start:459 stop:2507 length:2049 start_codon:yes stop_codon:yes gene_type:complete
VATVQAVSDDKAGFLTNLRVRTKILLGFTVVLIVLGAVLVFAFLSFVTISKDIDEYALHVEEASLIGQIEARFLRFSAHAREFANTAHEEDANRVYEIAAALAPLMEQAKQHFTNPDHQARIERMTDDLALYMHDFERSKELSDEYHGLILERLEPDGVKVLEDLNTLVRHAEMNSDFTMLKQVVSAREHALLAQLYANILIGRQDSSFGDKAAFEFSELEKILKSIEQNVQSSEDRLVIADAMKMFSDHRDVFGKIRKDELEIEDTVNGEMRTAAQEIISDAEKLMVEITAVEKTIFDRMMGAVGTAEKDILIASLAGGMMGIVIAWLLGNRLSHPIVAITGVMRRLADRDLEVVIPSQARRDEIGQMAGAVQVFKENAIHNNQLEAEAIEQEKRAKAAQRAFMNQTADSFNTSVGQILESVASAAVELQATADSMSNLASAASSQTAAVAAATEEASGNVQTVASATEELNASIEEINRQVILSSEVAHKAVEQAQDTFASMQELVNASDSIEAVLRLISDIAEQTNMLALNATIEASRAGEAGKGFAVVAGEVKNLAVQSTKATEEIARQVANIQSRTGDAVSRIELIGKTISEMDGIVSTISSAVEEQTAATREIAFNIEQAATGTTIVSSSIVSVSDAVRETGSASGDVLSAVTMLSENFTTLKGATDSFVSTIRAA